LKVATFFTGDELVEPGTPLQQGEIYNSNQYQINALLQLLGCEVINLGIVEDTLETTHETLHQAAQQADLVITSGGVSVGEEDHVRKAIEELGEINMWRLKIKPGKPLVFGRVESTPFLGLPGNPVSAFATFCLFVRPYILGMQGISERLPKTIMARADFEWKRPGIRREFLRARLSDDQTVSIYPHQGSGVLSSVCWANGLAVIPEDTTIAKGDTVSFIPFAELLT
jgi:molybdopterin molybdotransferase